MSRKRKVKIEIPQNQNTALLILQCIGIMAVVLGHANIGGANIPDFFKVAFPYYSWHMPFFIFISGYFFNRELSAGKYIVKKLRNHLLPALILNAACGVLCVCLKEFGLVHYGKGITFKSLFVTPFTTGYQFYINVSLWFIFALVIIEILACLMDRIARKKADIVYLAITLAVSVYCSYKVFYDYDGTRNEYLSAGLRLGYLMFFFWLGVCYRRYFEKALKRILNFRISLAILLVQSFVLGITGYKIISYTRNMNFTTITVPHGFWVAIVAPIIAIAFFFGIAYSLAPYFEGNVHLQEFGRNTKYVVYYHQFLFIFSSVILGMLIKLNVLPEIPGFSFDKLHVNQYYTGGNTAVACVVVILSTILPIAVCRRLKKLKWYFAGLIYLGIFAGTVLILYLAGKVIC